jgi:hypothetical protein
MSNEPSEGERGIVEPLNSWSRPSVSTLMREANQYLVRQAGAFASLQIHKEELG